MSRPLRIEYEGAWYHVMNRGINRQLIYKTTEHRNIFLSLLADLSQKFFVETHAFCLMDNHYHLLLKTPIPNLGKAMRHLDGLYTRKFNISEQRDGSIFKGRYKAILIEENGYLLQVSRYIHLNPIEAKICANPSEYPWSSYKCYLNKNHSFNWLKTATLLNFFDSSNSKKYAEFVSQGIDEEIKYFYTKKFFKSILGTEKFVKNTLLLLTKKQKKFCRPDIDRFKQLPSIEIIATLVAKYFSIEINALKETIPGKRNLPRILAIYLARQYGQITYKKISEYFTKLSTDSVGMIIKRFEHHRQDEDETTNHLTNLMEILAKEMLYVST